MPEPLPEITPYEPKRKLFVVSDGPSAASAVTVPAVTNAPAQASAEPVAEPAPASPADAPADAESVTDAPAETVTDASVTGVSDADADTDALLPAIAEFGREMSPFARAGLATAHSAGIIARAAARGAVKTRTWQGKPESLDAHKAWTADRKWIPDSVNYKNEDENVKDEDENVKDDGIITFLIALRNLWGWTFGLIFTAAGNFINWLRIPQHALLVGLAYLALYLFVIR